MTATRLLIICGFLTPLAFLLLGYTGYKEPRKPHPPLVIEKIIEKPVFLGKQPIFVEINEVPPPFDLNGHDPYVVWINGARVQIPKSYVDPIIAKIGKANIKPINIIDIHKGWLSPHFFHQPEKVVNKGRTRTLNEKQQTQ